MYAPAFERSNVATVDLFRTFRPQRPLSTEELNYRVFPLTSSSGMSGGTVDIFHLRNLMALPMLTESGLDWARKEMKGLMVCSRSLERTFSGGVE